MTDELRALIAQAERIARAGDRLTASFAAELALIWRQVERRISAEVAAAGISARAIRSLRKTVRDAFAAAGYDEFAVVAGVKSVESMASIVGTGAIPKTALTARLNALQAIASGNLLAQGDDAANALWRAVTQHVVAGKDVRDILSSLTAEIDRQEHRVGALFDTQVSIFGRQIEDERSRHLPPDQPYLYSGPIDGKTRDWCLSRVGKVYTREEIDRMDNGQIPNVFLSGGGYRCRHSFLAVESRELRGLSGTGQRADGYADDVERVERFKAEQRQRKAA